MYNKNPPLVCEMWLFSWQELGFSDAPTPATEGASCMACTFGSWSGTPLCWPTLGLGLGLKAPGQGHLFALLFGINLVVTHV